MIMHDLKHLLFSAQQARELDRIAIGEYGYTGLALMKTAGEKAFSIIMRRYSDVDSIIVLCGTGNNGGDGYVVANCAHRIGLDVIVVQAGQPKTEESIQVCQEFVNNGGRVQSDFPEQMRGTELIVDGLLGTGLIQAPGAQAGRLEPWAASGVGLEQLFSTDAQQRFRHGAPDHNILNYALRIDEEGSRQ